MGRAPCCEKKGLKKGPWSSEEDRILISYIHQHGHENWRALPKQAGLLRCGKSCRLRWTNYLRPDIKRGNFTNEEEETIIQLHETLGNRWSAIAAKLPGRTDNEIKNVWHTHLKKRLKNPKQHPVTPPKQDPNAPSQFKHENLSFPTPNGIESPVSPQQSSSEFSSVTDLTALPNNFSLDDEEMENFSEIDESFWSEELSTGNSNSQTESPVSPQQSSSEFSSVTDLTALPNNFLLNDEEMENFPEIDKSFCSEELSTGNSNSQTGISGPADELQLQFPFSPITEKGNESNFNIGDDLEDFWYGLFIRAGGQLELPEF